MTGLFEGLEWEMSQFSKSLKDMFAEEKEKALEEKFSGRERKIVNQYKSNKALHYFGSGKFCALVGESFADAVLYLKQQ